MILEDWKSLFESRILTRGAFPRKQCIVSTYHTFAKKPPRISRFLEVFLYFPNFFGFLDFCPKIQL